jgi:hypothetical protein
VSDHPYRSLPDSAFWRRAVAGQGPAIDPLTGGGFLTLGRDDKVATAGSCFAQNIARYLKRSGFDFLVTETAHPIIPAEAAERHGYGLYSARYGNIYTARQLLQLFDRAYGTFAPVEDIWPAADGARVVDPFRPTIEPQGYAGEAELRADRAHHLARVREMFETLDIFVFTLGLTEGWESTVDGAVFPICPGVSGGLFDPARHAFRNFRVGEVTADLSAFIARLHGVNPGARIILTVSPVPLVATASGNHVLAATTYSKSVLRAAAQEIAEDHDGVFYFPSYEIIMGAPAAARYFAEDMRNVTEEGVAHVMSVFLRHAAGLDLPVPTPAAAVEARDETLAAAREWVQVMCDEALLDPDSD